MFYLFFEYLKGVRWFASLAFVSCIFIPIQGVNYQCSAATYYVDSTFGNDNNDGLSLSTPWKTINEVNNSRFQPGDQILFERGKVWRETLIVPSSGTAEKPITFGAYGSGAKPVISGTDQITSWSPNGQPNVWTATVSTEPKIVLFDNTIGTQKPSKQDLKAQNDWYWAESTLYVYCTANPNLVYTQAGIQAGKRDLCVSVTNSYIMLQNLLLRGSNSFGIQLFNAKYVVMDGVDVTLTYFFGVDNNGGPEDFTSNLTIKDGEFSYCGAGGINLHGDATLNSITIQNNIAHHNGWNNVDNNFAKWSAGIKVWGGFGTGVSGASTNVIIEGNHCYLNLTENKTDGSGKGIWVDEWGSGAVVRYNNCHDNESDGIMIEHMDGAEVYYNLVYGNGSRYSYADGITLFRGVSNTKVLNNTVYNNRDAGISVVGGKEASEQAMIGNIVKNNIAVSNGRRQLQCTYGGENAGGGRENVYTHNCVGPESGAFIEWGAGIMKNTYAAWELVYGSDTLSVKKNPLFVLPGIDFHLQPTSPCVSAGTQVGITRDYEGNPVPQTGSVSIGALEQKSIGSPRNLRLVP